MNNRYPYLNSVIFIDKSQAHENEDENKTELSVNYSCSSSELNTDEQFQDIDLNEADYCGLNCQDILSWKVESESLDSVKSDNIETLAKNRSDEVSTQHCLRDANCVSSVSSLSSINSSNEIGLYSQSHIKQKSNLSKSQPHDIVHKTAPKLNQSNSLNIISHITQFLHNKNKSPKKSPTTPLKSTTCLILNDRPSGLPAKSPEELRRHRDEYNRLLNSIKKKEQRQFDNDKAKHQSKLNLEERQIQLTNTWRSVIIPNWTEQKKSKFVRHLWWEGIPTSVRDKVWKLCIPNTLKLTKVHYDNFLSQMQERIERYHEIKPTEFDTSTACTTIDNTVNCRPKNGRVKQNSESRLSSYDLYISETVSIHSQRSSTLSSSFNRHISTPRGSASCSSEIEMRQTLLNTIKLDVSRTFPHLNLFQDGGPHYDLLYQLLGAYTCYRPDIGYVQGMSFLAAILILVMNVEDAFIVFANIIEMPCHHAFYGLDENEFTIYMESFKLLLHTHLPQLGQHFDRNRLDVNIFLCDWLFTIFSRALPLETTLVVWDMFCRDGDSALFRAGLGILRCYEMQLLNSDFEELASFLTGQMPDSLTPAVLVEEMREIRLSQSKFAATMDEVRSRLARKN